MLRIVMVAALALVAVSAAGGADLLERTHIVGRCAPIVAPAGEEGSWLACRAGVLEGRPDLSLKSCDRRGLVHDLELWRCPAPVSASRTA